MLRDKSLHSFSAAYFFENAIRGQAGRGRFKQAGANTYARAHTLWHMVALWCFVQIEMFDDFWCFWSLRPTKISHAGFCWRAFHGIKQLRWVSSLNALFCCFSSILFELGEGCGVPLCHHHWPSRGHGLRAAASREPYTIFACDRSSQLFFLIPATLNSTPCYPYQHHPEGLRPVEDPSERCTFRCE